MIITLPVTRKADRKEKQVYYDTVKAENIQLWQD